MSKSIAWRLYALLGALTLSSTAFALNNGVYTIQSKHSGKVVEVGSADTTDGANVSQWPNNDHATQQWSISNISGNDFSVINVNSGKAMEVYNFDSTDGANIVQYTYWGGEPQIWTITDQGSGYYSFINKYSGKSLDLLDWDTTDGANIGQWAWWGGDAQLWSLTTVSTEITPEDVTITLEEQQTGFCSVDGTVDTNNTGYNGSGFANTANATSKGVNWQINVGAAGTYSLQWRFANGSTARPGDLLVNSSIQYYGVAFANTGAWTTWANTDTIELWLDPGAYTIRLQATATSGLANIDSLTITGPDVTAATCGPVVTPTAAPTPTPTPTPSEPIVFAAPSFTNTAVHDPSVIYANSQYYVFGSHLSVARSANMTEWSRVAEGVTTNNPIFNNVTNELSEALTWSETSTLWAPDIAYVNGKFLMYYNACRGDSPLSAMGIATSSNIEGPYSDQGLILRSGMWGQTSEDGTIFDALIHPNTVDPAVFTDTNGRLWMMYGSYSGGIFIMELNPSTGFPYSGQGYGKHLLGGNHSRIEAAYVIYAPETGYYYMFTSYGGLSADGAYNIRVARAQNPDGPYYDANGTNMSTVKSNPSLPLFDDASIAPHGVKLMGNFLFSDTNSELGYVSPGHNSAYRNADTGQYFIFFHTRFPGRGEEHEVRVHEFFYNNAGWPVIAPLRYAKKQDVNNMNRSQAELDAVAASEIAGSYQLINHGKDITATIKGSIDIQLNNGGSISGGANGSWSYNQNSKVASIILNGVTYNSVISRQWNQVRHRYEVTFTGLSNDGTAAWGIKSD